MALVLSKIRVSALLSQRVFIRPLSNLVNLLVGIISRPSSITCQIPPGTPELWPLNCSKTELAVSALKVEYILLPKMLSLLLNLPQIWRILCQFGTLVSLLYSFCEKSNVLQRFALLQLVFFSFCSFL